jgi:LIVCS family branched-chain amino acid:cation transporter
MGPFGVLARCLTVAHGALILIFPSASLQLSSLIMCLVIYLVAINKNRIVTLLGTVLTPFLLIAIGIIAFYGISQASFPETVASISGPNSWNAFKNGFFQGYQTMDLLAAFFFSQFVIKDLYARFSSNPEDPSAMKVFFKASMVGAGILSAVYFVLVLLGWIYSPILFEKPPQEMLGLIAMESLGSMAAPCLSIAVIVACLTTAIILASLFADFLRNEVAQSKIGNKTALLVTLVIGFGVSTLEFSGIAKFLGPVLETVYPALIVLTLVNIGCKIFKLKPSHWPFTVAIVAKLCNL